MMEYNKGMNVRDLLATLKEKPQTWTVHSWGAYINGRFMGSANKRSHVGTVAELVKRFNRYPKKTVIDRVDVRMKDRLGYPHYLSSGYKYIVDNENNIIEYELI